MTLRSLTIFDPQRLFQKMLDVDPLRWRFRKIWYQRLGAEHVMFHVRLVILKVVHVEPKSVTSGNLT